MFVPKRIRSRLPPLGKQGVSWQYDGLIDMYDRRLQSESSTGSTTSQRTRMVLTITVESVDFDPQVGLLRINGRVTSENPYVKVKRL